MVPRVASTCTILIFAVATLSSCTECPQLPELNAAQCGLLEAMVLPAELPRSVGNARADDERAALLGFSIFFDARFSSNAEVRCASCHIPERNFGDGRITAKGLEEVTRNSPSIYTAAWHRWQTWDGRADSVWSQPLLAFENPKEMNFTRLELAHRVAQSYRTPYEAVFGPLPELSDGARFPAQGKPGDPAFDRMAPADQFEINRVAANVGKAIEAYERKAAHRRGRFDDFLAGDVKALSAREQEGLVVFFKAGCAACHSGPQLADDAFHQVGVGANAERGRARALELLASDVFSASGPFHDGPAVDPTPMVRPEDEGAYRTPSLRNVARTGPWGHDGSLPTLEAAVHLDVTPAERAALVAFLAALDAGDPPSPWNNWPDR